MAGEPRALEAKARNSARYSGLKSMMGKGDGYSVVGDKFGSMRCSRDDGKSRLICYLQYL